MISVLLYLGRNCPSLQRSSNRPSVLTEVGPRWILRCQEFLVRGATARPPDVLDRGTIGIVDASQSRRRHRIVFLIERIVDDARACRKLPLPPRHPLKESGPEKHQEISN